MKRLIMLLIGVALSAAPAMAQDVCAPAKVTTISTTTLYGAIEVIWTATGDDCNTGNSSTYEVRYSTSQFSPSNCGTFLCDGNSAANGSQNSCCLTVVPCATTTYYFAIYQIDEAGNRSPINDTVSGAARCTPPYITCP